jgi:hypothetical protein
MRELKVGPFSIMRGLSIFPQKNWLIILGKKFVEA